jgi:TRAP-type C4-dicarboxylate transport system permease small subunit
MAETQGTTSMETPAPVLDADGHFHATDEPIDLSHYSLEAWIAFGLFWVLALDIFYQFFTRYALNDSAAWTEEIARYLLIATVWIGLAAAVKLQRHIHVDFFYRFMGYRVGRFFATLVDIVQIAFFATAAVLTWQMMQKMTSYRMTIVDLPMNTVYAVCLVGFALAAVRSVGVARKHWRERSSLLEHPETGIVTEDLGPAPGGRAMERAKETVS